MGVNKIRLNSDVKIEQLVKEIISHPDKQVIIEVITDTTVLKNEINLRLLKFYAEEEEKELVIQSNDSSLLSMAQRLGISTLREAELVMDLSEEICQDGEREIAATPEFKQSEKEPHWWRGEWVTAVLIILFTLGIALWWFMQPKAVITVFPKYQDLEFTAQAKISNIYKDEDILNSEIPASVLIKEASLPVQIITTGKKNIGITAAIGKVFFTNSSNQPVVLPKGTILSGKDGVRLATDNEVLVPQKSVKVESGIEVGTVYGRVEVGVTAIKLGTSGNQPAKSVTRIEGKFQRLLKVINPAPIVNGTDKMVSIVTLEDVKKGEAEARHQMQLVSPDTITSLIGKEYLYLPELAKLEVIKIYYDQNIGMESDVLQTNLDYRITVVAAYVTGINKFLAKQLDHNLPPNFEAINSQVKLVSANVTDQNDKISKIQIIGKGRIRGVLNPQKIKDLIRGKSLSIAKATLLAQNEIERSNIVISGSGSKLPGYVFQIRVLLPDGTRPK